MCTVSWLYTIDGYELLCNRDEKRTRAQAICPSVMSRGPVRFIAPIDRDHGGTWVAANEFGVTLCLLNAGSAQSHSTSRGAMIMDLADAIDLREVRRRIGNLASFAPFILVALERRAPASVFQWNGEHLSVSDTVDSGPLTSSSFDSVGVDQTRREDFRRHIPPSGAITSEALWAFHQSHGTGPAFGDAYSTCMHRADASTVSFSCVKASASGISFFYTPAALCQRVPGETIYLPCATGVAV